MNEKTQYISNASMGIINYLGQELGVSPYYEYTPKARNSMRVFSLKLEGLNAHYLNKMIAMQARLTMAAGLGEETPVRVTYGEYGLILEIPKPRHLWKNFTLEALGRKRYIERSGPVATVGVDTANDPVKINYTRPDTVHTFVIGQTGSGKTNCQRLIAWNLCHHSQDAQMIIFDVAKVGYNWTDFNNTANLVHPVVKDLAEADRVLMWANMELDRRAAQGRARQWPKLFLFIDETKSLIDDSELATDCLNRLARMGREFNLHLCLSTQYPQSSILGKDAAEMKRNVNIRLCGKVDDAIAAVNALGVKNSGAETLQGLGDFLLRDSDGLKRLAVTKIEDHHIKMLKRAEVKTLDLPGDDAVNNGPQPVTKQADPIEPEQAATALFRPMGINRLASELSIGSTKAKRVKEYADRMKEWATGKGYRISDNHGWTEFEYYDPIPHLD